MRFRAFIIALFAVCLTVLPFSGNAWAQSRTGVTYDDIRGTGLANKCQTLGETVRGSFPLESGQEYVLTDLCVEPINFFVKEESKNARREAEFVSTKVTTRYTTSLEGVNGALKFNADGGLTFFEEDGMDFQPITVKTPGGELVPLLFTLKGLEATTQGNLSAINTSTDFKGEYEVPSYRTSNFLDPKGRGLTTGYDNAVARPGVADDADLTRTNVKRFVVGKGDISLQVAKVDGRTGEIAGTFVAEQPSDTDMGARDPLEVKIQGVFYGRVSPVEA
ncbi:MAG: photosystem II manganese-stabilizing polypeptide [Thermosynechococcaceae cyanobacterium]